MIKSRSVFTHLARVVVSLSFSLISYFLALLTFHCYICISPHVLATISLSLGECETQSKFYDIIACKGLVLVTGTEEIHYLFLYQMLNTNINNAGTGPVVSERSLR